MKTIVFALFSLTVIQNSFAHEVTGNCRRIQNVVRNNLIPQITEATKANYWFYGAQIVDYHKNDGVGIAACMYQNKYNRKIYHYFSPMRNTTVTAEQIEEFGWKIRVLPTGTVNFTCKSKDHTPTTECSFTVVNPPPYSCKRLNYAN